MGKGKGIFKRIAAGALSFTMLCGMVTPAFAAGKNKVKNTKFNADMVVAIDISGSMSGEKITKAKKSAKNMINSIWKGQDEYYINTNVALVTFESNVVHHKNGDKDFFNRSDKDKLFNEIDGLETDGSTFTQGGLYKTRMMFRNSKADKKILVLLSDGEPNYVYKPKFDVDDYMKNNKEVVDNQFEYDGGKYDDGMNDDKYKFCTLAEAKLCEKENVDVLDIYTVSVDCSDDAKKLLEEIATDKDHAKDTDTSDLEDTFDDLTNQIKDKLAKEELEKEINDLNNKIDELSDSKKELEDKLKDEQVANAKDKEELNKKIEELEDKLTEAEKDKKATEDELKNKDKELQDKIADLNKKTSELEKEKNQLEKELADSKGKSEADKKELNDNITDLEKKIKDHEAEKKASKEEQKKVNKDLQDKIADLNKKTSELEKEKNDLEKKLETDKSKSQKELNNSRTLFSRKIIQENQWKWSQEVIIIRIKSKKNEFNDESQALLIERYIGNKFGLFDS